MDNAAIGNHRKIRCVDKDKVNKGSLLNLLEIQVLVLSLGKTYSSRFPWLEVLLLARRFSNS